MGIGKRIQAAMIRAKKRPVDIANHLDIKDAAVHQWFAKDSGPRTTRLPALARYLNVTVDHLIQDPLRNDPVGNRTIDVRPAEPDVSLTGAGEFDRAVYVTEITPPSSSGGDFVMGHLSRARVRIPPKLAERTDIIAFYVEGGGQPKYDTGDLVFCESLIPARPGDYVVVTLKSGSSYLRKLIDRSAASIRLLDPGAPAPLQIGMAKVASVLRVMTTQDLLG